MSVDPNDEDFWGVGGKRTFLASLKEQNRRGMEYGVECEWWESFDPETLDPIPFPLVVCRSSLHEKATMANVMFDAGIFNSVGEARRAGWNKPIELGDFVVGKKKIRIRIVD